MQTLAISCRSIDADVSRITTKITSMAADSAIKEAKSAHGSFEKSTAELSSTLGCDHEATTRFDQPEPEQETVVVYELKSESGLNKFHLWLTQSTNRLLWDVILETDDGVQICANRLDLAVASEFFLVAFTTSGFCDTGGEIFKVREICGRCLRAFVESLYSHELTISTDNVQEFIELSQRLQLIEILEACETFLMKRITTTNVTDMVLIADTRGLQRLLEASIKHIHFNFREINDIAAQKQTLGQIPFSVWYDGLQCGYYNNNEKLDLIHGFVNCHRSTPLMQAELAALFQLVDFELLSFSQLQQLSEESFVSDNPEVLQQILKLLFATARAYCELTPQLLVSRVKDYEAGTPDLHVWRIPSWTDEVRTAFWKCWCSPPFMLAGISSPWGLELDARNDCVSLYLRLQEPGKVAHGELEKINKCTLDLINQKDPARTVAKAFVFHEGQYVVGHERFCARRDIVDPERGYIADDCIAVRVRVQYPKGPHRKRKTAINVKLDWAEDD